MLVEEANSDYMMLVASNWWGPSGKPDSGAAPEGLYTKAKLNTLVQNLISAAFKNHGSKHHEHSDNKQSKCCLHYRSPRNHTKQAWEAQPPSSSKSEKKEVDGKTWYWCRHYGFWHLSHSTADHKDPSTLGDLTKPMANKPHTTKPTTNLTEHALHFCGDVMLSDK